MNRIVIVLCLALISPLITPTRTTPRTPPLRSRVFQNHYLRIHLLPGWTVEPPDQETQKVSSDCCTLNITHGKYVLAINPVFIHASGVDGGRVGEILPGRPSVIAVIGDDDAEDVTSQCAQWSDTHVSKKVTLRNLYIDPEKKSEYCNLSLPPHPVWFASFDSGEGPESDYSVALTSTTSDLNALPRKDSPELRQVISDVTRMLRTLRLKPPIVITKIVPASAPPGATVTIYGSGFKLLDRPAEVSFREFPNNSMPPPQVAADGKSLTFQVPASIDKISCPPGRIDINEWCVPIPPHRVDLNDCPPPSRAPSNFCGVPVPPATYGVSVTAGEGIFTEPVAFTITAPQPPPVSIVLLYPNGLVSPGDTITVRGSGFTPTGNTVHIGSATVAGITSPDGKTITFTAPAPQGTSFMPRLQYFQASISNANGQSNSVVFSYR